MNSQGFYKAFKYVTCLIPIISLFYTGLLFGQNMQQPDAPQNLLCEYQSNPLGMDIIKPRLSWKVNDKRRGAIQIAYQILVSSNEKLLKNNESDIWNSGKVISDQSLHVPYDGPPLESRKRYFWKVRTWDALEEASPYSKYAWWEMGMLKPNDWQAEWISKEPEMKEDTAEEWPWGQWIWHPTETGIDIPVYFRKNFNLQVNKKITNATLKITADNYFTTYLNDIELGSGDSWSDVYEFDCLKQLHTKKNIIAIKAANARGVACGLIVSLKIEFEDGSRLVVNSDKSWKSETHKQSGWRLSEFTDEQWDEVKLFEKYGGSQWGKVDAKEAYVPPRSVLLRKQFRVNKSVKQARVYVSGLGSYILHINGNRVGEDIFTPGWTDYPSRIQYQTYNVTSLLQNGENAVGAILGNMWWSGGFGEKGSIVYSEGPLRLLMQLVIDYEDGSSKRIITDRSWKAHDSPILENHIYHGETYDARLEIPKWDKPDLDDSNWLSVIVPEQEKLKLVAQQSPTIQVTQEIKPMEINEPNSGIFVFDMGQNMAGWVKLKVKGKAGTKVVLRFAEVLNKDGNIDTKNLRKARSTDTYILNGGETEIWEPHFTYHGFRYVEVSGYPGKPDKEAITGRVLHSEAPKIGEFSCSNELINQIQKNINWTQRSNMYSVPTDCPQRDERLGWMGDPLIFSSTACYNRNMARFFTKWTNDMTDCQEENGAVHNVSPTIVVTMPAQPGFGDALIIIPWKVYRFYGDKRIIEDNYSEMASWLEYITNKTENYLYTEKGYGDWNAVEESPFLPIGTAHIYHSTVLMEKMAKIIGKFNDVTKYRQLAIKIKKAYNAAWLERKTSQYKGATQTANLMPIYFGIAPEELTPAIAANIACDITRRNNHLSTGFFGSSYLLPALTQHGYHDLAYKLATQNTYPSWGYMVEKGATTIWEHWDSDRESPEMNSYNHPAFGAVGEWYYGYLAGLRDDPAQPGFRRAIIAPQPVGDLTWAKASIETSYGSLISFWKITKQSLIIKISIPANTSAEVHIPILGIGKPTIFEGEQLLLKEGKFVINVDGVVFKELTKNEAIFIVGSGEYEFKV